MCVDSTLSRDKLEYTFMAPLRRVHVRNRFSDRIRLIWLVIKNNMGQKRKGNCSLWVLNEMIKKLYPENLKKIMVAVWELPAK